MPIPWPCVKVDWFMAKLPWRLLGLLLLVLAIGIPSCQALFPRTVADGPRQFQPGFVRD